MGGEGGEEIFSELASSDNRREAATRGETPLSLEAKTDPVAALRLADLIAGALYLAPCIRRDPRVWRWLAADHALQSACPPRMDQYGSVHNVDKGISYRKLGALHLSRSEEVAVAGG